jgi:parvulin-like peptidyl-prolyl isomerase
MNLRLPAALLLTATLAQAQLRKPTLEETAAQRWSETNKDQVVGIAAGTPIILSEVRRQVEPIAGQARASAKSDAEFFATLERASKETLRSMADRQLVIAEFRADRGRLPASYIDADIEETIRRDYAGDRNRFVASLRAAGLTPLSYRKFIEDRIIFDYMVGQIRRTATEVGPGRTKEFYDKNMDLFTRDEQVRFRQIAVTQGAAETAEAAAARAADWAEAAAHPERIPALLAKHKVAVPAGAKVETFADLAKLVSTDDFAARGGDAGWLGVANLTERIVTTLRGLADGQVSAPLRFDIPGAKPVWFILRREGWRARGAASLSEPDVLADVENRVRAAAMKEAVDEWLQGLRAKHHLQLDR